MTEHEEILKSVEQAINYAKAAYDATYRIEKQLSVMKTNGFPKPHRSWQDILLKLAAHGFPTEACKTCFYGSQHITSESILKKWENSKENEES